MLIRIFTIIFLSFLLPPLLPGHGFCAPADQKKPLTVFVSILPMVDFVGEIAGNRSRVLPMVLPGQSPATYTPTPKQMAALAEADLYFRIGVPFENSLLSKLQHNIPELKVIDLRTGIELIAEKTGATGAPDPHIWLDPGLVKQMALSIRDALIRLDPEGAEIYRTNCRQFRTKLNQLDQQLRRILQPLAGQTIYVFHPAYAYFCRAYNLVQRPIAPGGKTPGARYLARIIEQASRDQVRFIFIQPQFSRKTAQAIASAIGATLIPLDPLAKDYIDNMETMGRRIAEALRRNPTTGN